MRDSEPMEAWTASDDADASGSNVLLNCSAVQKRERCSTLFGAVGAEECSVLEVSLTHPVGDRLVRWTETIDDAPARIAFLTPDRATAARRTVDRSDLDDVRVDPIDPEDVQRLGVRISEAVELLADSGERIVVCFDSVTALLRSVGTEAAFRFLHLLTARFRSVDAFAHFHFDPAVHDDATVSAIEQLFDVVVDVGSSGPTAGGPGTVG